MKRWMWTVATLIVVIGGIVWLTFVFAFNAFWLVTVFGAVVLWLVYDFRHGSDLWLETWRDRFKD